MVLIRLTRCGHKHAPRYRINVADSRRSSTGRFIETLGTYNPFTKDVKVDEEKYKEWIKKGAQPTSRVKSLIEKKTKN